MSRVRIIARLDIKGPNVIKGIRYDGLRIMGDPDEMACRYYEQGADELLYIDTVASLYERNNLTEVVRRAGAHIFIPMTVGGGIRSVEDAQKLLHSGADKVAVNTAAVKRPELISEIAARLGSQAVVVSLQVKRKTHEAWEIYIDCGREKTGIDALSWAKQAQDLGAGELLVTSVDKDGTQEGFELEFIKQMSRSVSVPVIASGGAGKPDDIVRVVNEGEVDAVAIGSILHYNKHTIAVIKERLTATAAQAVLH